LNLSATLERALADEVRKAERAQWLEQNKKAIAAANALADENGRFVDAYRTL
jgi:antitoxin CcdA